jgi:hypothetical protein
LAWMIIPERSDSPMQMLAANVAAPLKDRGG